MPRASLTRKVRFAAAHRYFRPEWSEEENRRVFGLCANPHGHGHNYLLEVTVEGEIDPVTGFCVDLDALDRMLDERVRQPLDHQHLNHAVPAFAPGGAIPTTENILAYLWPTLAEAVPAPARLVRLRLHEEDGFHVDFDGGQAAPAP
jgi:6-pyruvoyltetrahydropterin/6-carboxytetrahydropterin synthase